jgi:hypothetical protein
MLSTDLGASMIREAARIEEDGTYSAKGHFEAARIWGWCNLALGLPAVVLGAVAGVSALKSMPIAAGVLAILGSALTAALTFLKPSDRISSHHVAGTRFSSLKNRARFFREVELPQETDPKRLTRSLRGLAKERNELNQLSPEIPRPAFVRARRGIVAGENVYVTDQPTRTADGTPS